MSFRRLHSLLKTLCGSTPREQRRILLLLPLLIGVCLLFRWPGKPRFERSFTLYSDAVVEATPKSQRSFSPEKIELEAPVARTQTEILPAPFVFDPNTIDQEGLLRLGFSERQAQGILNYRAAGAVFRRKEDFARCYTVSADRFAVLAPYIRIGETYRRPEPTSERPATLPAERDAGRIARQTVLQEQTAENPLPSLPPGTAGPAGMLELNGADSAALVAVRGIGALTAGRILRYRQRLGGFAVERQLREVAGVTEENYQLILQQIFIDPRKIQKIDINFATPEQLGRHPYLPPRVIDKILKNRQLRGGYSSVQELIEQHILSGEQAARLAPYLHFGIQGFPITEF